MVKNILRYKKHKTSLRNIKEISKPNNDVRKKVELIKSKIISFEV